MYAQYRAMKAQQCLLLPPGTTPAEGASCFVNPLTALGMVETMRREGHTALVHTAAASNLGQMLQQALPRGRRRRSSTSCASPSRRSSCAAIGAMHVCDSSSPTFMDDLTDALVATGATLAFDATGGGKLAGQILTAMEAARSTDREGVQPLRLDRRTSRSTSTAASTAARPSSRATSAWRGASAAGC